MFGPFGFLGTPVVVVISVPLTKEEHTELRRLQDAVTAAQETLELVDLTDDSTKEKEAVEAARKALNDFVNSLFA